MPTPSQPQFTFQVSTLPADAFHVVRFTGQEGLSTLYSFEVTLQAARGPVDMARALEGDASLAVRVAPERQTAWKGVLREFHMLDRVEGRPFYRAVLVPRAHVLGMTRQSRIFLDKTTPQILRECLQSAGLAQGHDFDMVTTLPYNKREYVCQYEETDLAFVSRWMERNGLYYSFDHTGDREKLVVTDTRNAHKPLPDGHELDYREPSGLAPGQPGRTCRRLRLERRRLSRDIALRDYNYRTPAVAIEHQTVIAEAGQGALRLQGGNIRSAKEATYLAHLQAQIHQCREALFFGETDAPGLSPGWTFSLRDHPQQDLNQDYLALEVLHEGSQEAQLAPGAAREDGGDRPFYRNAFTAIPAATQYRSEQRTPRPWIAGMLHAFIDAEGSGETPEIDDQGRYKVILPFDRSGRSGGRASAWLRMIQPYAGSGHGLHLPLHKGTEVALLFEEGDPDRPVIAGAVPNPLTRSPVTSANQTQACLTSAGGNKFHMEDRQGSQYVHFSSPVAGTRMQLGAGGPDFTQDDQNELDTLWQNYQTSSSYLGAGGVTFTTQGVFSVKAQTTNVLTLGENTQLTVGGYSCSFIGGSFTLNAGVSVALNLAAHTEFAPFWYEMRGSKRQAQEKQDKVVASLVTMCGDKTNVGEVVNDVVTEKTEAYATQDALLDAKREFVTEVQQVRARVNTVASSEERLRNEFRSCIDRRVANLVSEEKLAAELKLMATTLEQTLLSKRVTAVSVSTTTESEDKVVGVSTMAAGTVDVV
ncbi:Actin cross-linking toxin VgrG1 [Fundidesulfovibrio magnetotacticus]|uniref:Actin cross-linking toxin VgrG1 n=1 Tax=Fundidesulfovibrio magnetotacticus TaxID=2730080 RepID=A0A6V8LYV7_9BACT|nr:type VI secretion system tip protein TssI/VgrG [Fundidesulfovibrio magnetotacticus]GFK95771.1 Actin cross-linking toxin VgrG1 [Fundidesulfovibrio magnetotacticus]